MSLLFCLVKEAYHRLVIILLLRNGDYCSKLKFNIETKDQIPSAPRLICTVTAQHKNHECCSNKHRQHEKQHISHRRCLRYIITAHYKSLIFSIVFQTYHSRLQENLKHATPVLTLSAPNTIILLTIKAYMLNVMHQLLN